MRTVGNLFRLPPSQWGLRGDPFLWKDMSRVFRPVPLPDSSDKLKAMLEAAFLALTEKPISSCNVFKIERYAHGGMSSGCISAKFWKNKGIPLLIERFHAQQQDQADGN